MRRPILAANWKMQKTAGEAVAFAEAFLPLVSDANDVDIVVAPPFTGLDRLGRALAGSAVALAAQNVNPEEKGAFTGEIAPGMLADLGCAYTIVGHSERRALYGEVDGFIARKAAALLAHGIRPIVCVGETLEDREADRTFDVVGQQLSGSLAGLDAAQADDVVVAYEPVWAIGTGKTATPELAQEVHAFIREALAKPFGGDAARIRIQYGGSVKPENAVELMAQPDIDGALVGGASLEAESFAQIVRSATGSSA
ncbi:MAG: triose-phosphate isomerase [Proteobacteria bacterium]|nr:triose-phosphate isomerase [Pseudomonadota bacterium]